MASNPVNKLFHGIYENTLVIFHKAGEALEEMMVVSLDSSGDLVKCSGDMEPYGFCAQKATDSGYDELELNGLITRVAEVGNELYPCGCYVGSNGVLKTDQVHGEVSAGDKLYPHDTDSGKICKSGQNGSAVQIGVALADKDSDGVVKFRTRL